MDQASDHIEIHLPVHGIQIAFLSIPQSDIQRLATRPFKWLRFVMFSICGARGDLSESPDGPRVNYESTSLNRDRYYYKPWEEFAFVDPHGLNGRISISASTARPADSRDNVMERDGEFCVFTETHGAHCDAAHLIPKSKGDEVISTIIRCASSDILFEYIRRVIEDRARCYEPTQPGMTLSIDAVENGMLLGKHLHSMYSVGDVAFLKTPNFAMDSTDVPRIARGPPDADHITAHQFVKPRRYNPDNVQRLLAEAASGYAPCPSVAFAMGLHVDASFQGTKNMEHIPPAIVLDFMYGVAAYDRWKCGSVHDVVKDYFASHYESILAPPHVDDGDCRSKREDVLVNAMDEMNLVMMFFSGITPEEAARNRERRIEEEEQKVQEAGRAKVMEWRKTVDCS